MTDSSDDRDRKATGDGSVVIEMVDVTKRFGGVVANRDVSLRVRRAEIVGVVGPNGSGKTTLFNLIAGAHKPDSGRIILDGDDITNLTPDRVCRRGIARTFQEMKLFLDLTAQDNVLIGALVNNQNTRSARRVAQERLSEVGLSSKAKHLAGSLSTGQRKRLELARSMATDPRVILLDEVLAGVDPGSREPILEILRDLQSRRVTVLMIEHNLKVVRELCGHVIAMDGGEVVMEGAPEAVFSDAEVISSYIGRTRA